MFKQVHPQRIRILKESTVQSGTNVLYWMSRDQRAHNNWAMLFAQSKARELKGELIVAFNIMPHFLEATIRHYDFMIKGLQIVEKELSRFNIPFIITIGDSAKNIESLADNYNCETIITDFDPLKTKLLWKKQLLSKTSKSIFEVDAHNIVPCTFVSNKQEYGAHTLRPKINRSLSTFLEPYQLLTKQPNSILSSKVDWNALYRSLQVNKEVQPVQHLIPGELEARTLMKSFIADKLSLYGRDRNDPNLQATSQLSAYLHFGHISSQEVALAVNASGYSAEITAPFLEELIVRKELSDNFCNFNKNYDSYAGFPSWAKESLDKHNHDKRELIYSLDQFEHSKTYDPLWNAAQCQLKNSGTMHGYMRMYWAKKILEWSRNPEDALKTSIVLNNKYQLDGRDPNGYTGCAWSIGGTHDRAWKERPILGKIRYMNYEGCKRKFDCDKYIKTYLH